MNKVILGHLARAEYLLGIGETLGAIDAYKKCTELPDVWRQLGLAYAEIEDLDSSINALNNAIKAGDNKSIPWLVDLLESHRPDDPNYESTKKLLEQGVADNNVDIIFSLGNLQYVAGELGEAIRIWMDFIPADHWVINRNLARNIIDQFYQFGELIPPPYGPIDTPEKAAEFFLHVNEKAYAQGEVEAFCELGSMFLLNPETEVLAKYSARKFFDTYIEHAKSGHAQSVMMALYFAGNFQSENLDDSELMELLKEYGIFDLVELMGYGKSVEEAIGARWGGMQSATSKDAVRISELFEIADAAAKSGDSLAEVGAWVEGANLGDENCFHNLGITLCNELGIVQNFFGSQGGEGHAWTPLAKGIGGNEDRPGRGPAQLLSRYLSSTQIAHVRSTYGGHPSVEPEPLKPGQAQSLIKICDLFEKSGYIHQVIDQNLIAIPYTSEYGSHVILCELINDDGKDMALIYTCLLTSKFDDEGKPISQQSGLSIVQEKVLSILIREQELIFPGMMIMIGDVFNSLPQGAAPESFINISKAKEVWSLIGASAESMFFEALPTKHEFEKFEFGYGIDIELQSDHFESGIRGIVGSITGMLGLISAMHNESKELFELIFDYQPSTSFDFGKDSVPYSELATQGSRTAQAIVVFEEKDQSKRLQKLVELSATGMHVATRAMPDAVEYTPENIDTIAGWMLKEAELVENNSQIRELLNNLGWAYRGFGEEEKALPFFEKSANLGCGNAMSNLNWYLLSNDGHELARKVFDESYYRIMTTRETENDFQQGANSRSNDALHRFALGASHEELREIWGETHFQENHLESRFYLTLLDHLDGNSDKAEEGLSQLSSQEKKELVDTFKELLAGDTWIAGIAKISLELLSEEPQKKKGLFRR